jgi:MFS family permease
MAISPVWLVAPALTSSPWWVGAAGIIAGTGVIWNVITVSLRQRIAPDHLLGRVNAGYRLLAWGTMPIGAALGGLLADGIGLRATFLVTAAGALLSVPLLLSGVSDAAIDEAEAPEREPDPLTADRSTP